MSMLLMMIAGLIAHADFNSEVEKNLSSRERNNDACYEVSTDLAGQTACAKDAASNVKIYMDNLLNVWYEPLRAGPRGEDAYRLLIETQQFWTQYRRDLCNFVAEYHMDGPENQDVGAFWGQHCVIKSTIARIREMFQLR